MKRRSLKNLLVLILLFSITFGCASGQKTSRTRSKKNPENKVTSVDINSILSDESSDRVRTDAQQIRELYERNNFSTTVERASEFEKRNPKTIILPQILNLKGLALLRLKKAEESVLVFTKAVSLVDRWGGKAAGLRPYLLFNLASAHMETSQPASALQVVESIELSGMDAENQLKTELLKMRLYALRLDWSKAALSSMQALEIMVTHQDSEPLQGKTSANSIHNALRNYVSQIQDFDFLKSLYERYENLPGSDAVLFRIAEIEASKGNLGTAKEDFRTLLRKYPSSPHGPDAEAFLARMDREIPLQKKTIGVLLPLSGKYSKLGLKTLRAIQMAFRVFPETESLEGSDKDPRAPTIKNFGGGFKLVVLDSGDEVSTAVKGFERLVMEFGAIAVIGPISSKGVEQIAQLAESYRVPVLSLVQGAAADNVKNNFMIQAGLSADLQIRSLVDFSIHQLKLKRFAIVHPQDRFGEEYAKRFWDTVEEMGGEIRGIESYPGGETNFVTPVEKLVGLFYEGARSREIKELADLREKEKITKRNRKTENYFALPPIVDFEAVFIPESVKVATQVIPTFAYKDVDQVKFLGLPLWNSPDLWNRLGPLSKNVYFVEAFNKEATGSRIQNFVQSYEKNYKEKPESLDAFAYDAGSIVSTIMQGTPESRDTFLDRIRSISKFTGVTGLISYSNGTLERPLQILTIKDGHFLPATP